MRVIYICQTLTTFTSIESKICNCDFFFQLKAFYVDMLVPLETNLEKDTKVVQVRS